MQIKTMLLFLVVSLFWQNFIFGDKELFEAINKRDYKRAEANLKKGLNGIETDSEGRSPLMIAIKNNDRKMVDLLIPFTANECVFDKSGNNPLVYATINGDLKIFKSLDFLNCNILEKGKSGESLIDLANTLGHSDLVREFESRGMKLKKSGSENITLTTYMFYLLISICMTVWVARTLKTNGRIFLIETFQKEDLADSVNHLLVVGFYLVNIGFISLALKIGLKPGNIVEGVETLSEKVGYVLLVLGGMHFFNIFMFGRLKKKTSENRAAINKES
jgi:ankyrin repeat protein